MRTLAVVILMAGAAWAQSDPQERAKRRADGLKNRLELSDEQTEKVTEAYAKEEEGRQKLEEERVAKVKEALSDDQKTQYDELRNRFSGGNRGRGGFGGGRGGFRGGFGGFNMGAMIDGLKDQLSLTDDQLSKIRPIVEEAGDKIRKRFEDLRGGGGGDWRSALQEVRADMEKVNEQIKEHLNEEQKAQYAELVESRMRFFGGRSGNRERGTATVSRRSRRPSVEDRVARAIEALEIKNEEERAAIAGLIKQVVKAIYALQDYEGETRQTLTDVSRNEELSDDAVKDRLKERRSGRKELEKKLKSLRGDLKEVVTYRQELVLVVRDILD